MTRTADGTPIVPDMMQILAAAVAEWHAKPEIDRRRILKDEEEARAALIPA